MIHTGLRGVIVVTALTNQKEHRQHNEPIIFELQVADSKHGKMINNNNNNNNLLLIERYLQL